MMMDDLDRRRMGMMHDRRIRDADAAAATENAEYAEGLEPAMWAIIGILIGVTIVIFIMVAGYCWKLYGPTLTWEQGPVRRPTQPPEKKYRPDDRRRNDDRRHRRSREQDLRGRDKYETSSRHRRDRDEYNGRKRERDDYSGRKYERNGYNGRKSDRNGRRNERDDYSGRKIDRNEYQDSKEFAGRKESEEYSGRRRDGSRGKTRGSSHDAASQRDVSRHRQDRESRRRNGNGHDSQHRNRSAPMRQVSSKDVPFSHSKRDPPFAHYPGAKSDSKLVKGERYYRDEDGKVHRVDSYGWVDQLSYDTLCRISSKIQRDRYKRGFGPPREMRKRMSEKIRTIENKLAVGQDEIDQVSRSERSHSARRSKQRLDREQDMLRSDKLRSRSRKRDRIQRLRENRSDYQTEGVNPAAIPDRAQMQSRSHTSAQRYSAPIDHRTAASLSYASGQNYDHTLPMNQGGDSQVPIQVQQPVYQQGMPNVGQPQIRDVTQDLSTSTAKSKPRIRNDGSASIQTQNKSETLSAVCPYQSPDHAQPKIRVRARIGKTQYECVKPLKQFLGPYYPDTSVPSITAPGFDVPIRQDVSTGFPVPKSPMLSPAGSITRPTVPIAYPVNQVMVPTNQAMSNTLQMMTPTNQAPRPGGPMAVPGQLPQVLRVSVQALGRNGDPNTEAADAGHVTTIPIDIRGLGTDSPQMV